MITIVGTLITVGCHKESSVATNRSAPATAPSTTPDQLAAARETYAKRCASCHGEKGEGGTGEFEGKKIKGPPFRSGHALRHVDADFVKQIDKGGEGMPAFGEKLSAREIDDLVKFIRKDFQGGNNPQASLLK